MDINDDDVKGYPVEPEEVDDEDEYIPGPDEFAVRRLAFDTAIQLYGNRDTPASAEEIVQSAKVFETYLNGKE